MTLPLNSRLSALYDTNGTQKEFGFGFRVFFDPDNGGYGLEVRRQTADGYEVIPKSDYLVLPVEDNSAGVVRFSVAPSAGQQIYIAGKTPTIQQLVLTNFGRYSAESIETQFDFITAIIQEWLSSLSEEQRQRIASDLQIKDYSDSKNLELKNFLENLINEQGIAVGQLKDYYDSLIDRLENTAVDRGWLAELVVDSSGNNQQWVNDKKTLKTFYDFGAKGDGITDDTTAIRLAAVYSAMYGVEIVQNDGDFLVSTFDQTLSDGIICAIPLAGNLKLSGTGRIKSNQTGTTRTIFGIDERANGKNISISSIKFTGNARYRAIHSTAAAELNTLDVLGVRTARQSIVLTSDIKTSIRVKNNRIGEDITATTNVTPTMVVTLPKTSVNYPEYDCSKNFLIGGTETTTGTSYAFHNVPPGGKADDNILVNIGKSQTEGYDIDGLGRMASFSRNVAIFSDFEYKMGSDGLTKSRDVFFHDNLSWEAFGTAFSIRSSCNARGNIAYNPKGWGLWMGGGSPDVDGLLLRSGIIDIDGFKIIWAGAPWPGAVKIEAIVKQFDFKKLSVEIDPVYKFNNPTAKMTASGGSILNIDGDFDYLAFDKLFIDDSLHDQVNIRPITRAKNVFFTNPIFGECDDSCIDVQNIDNFVIHNPVFPDTAGDRPVRSSGCDNIDVRAKNFQNIDNIVTSGGIHALVNGYGSEAVGSAGRPMGVDWRVGSIVTNTFDQSTWLKIYASSGTAAWRRLISLPVTATYDPPSLATGQQQSTTVTLNGAVLGDMVACSFNRPLDGSRMWAEVTAANTVTVYHRNDTGAPLDIASGTLSVKLL